MHLIIIVTCIGWLLVAFTRTFRVILLLWWSCVDRIWLFFAVVLLVNKFGAILGSKAFAWISAYLSIFWRILEGSLSWDCVYGLVDLLVVGFLVVLLGRKGNVGLNARLFKPKLLGLGVILTRVILLLLDETIFASFVEPRSVTSSGSLTFIKNGAIFFRIAISWTFCGFYCVEISRRYRVFVMIWQIQMLVVKQGWLLRSIWAQIAQIFVALKLASVLDLSRPWIATLVEIGAFAGTFRKGGWSVSYKLFRPGEPARIVPIFKGFLVGGHTAITLQIDLLRTRSSGGLLVNT